MFLTMECPIQSENSHQTSPGPLQKSSVRALVCGLCWGFKTFVELDVASKHYIPGQVRRVDRGTKRIVSLKAVTIVPDAYQPWTVEDWVPVHPRKRPRKQNTYKFCPMFDLPKKRHFKGYTFLH